MGRIVRIVAVLALAAPPALAGQADPPQAVDSTPVLQIGDVLGDSKAYSFTSISGMAVLGDSILVLESEANEIRIFDEGAFLGRIGGEGEGPGEFLWATALHLTPDGISVVDLRLRRQTFFSLAGELLRTEPLGELPDQALAGSAVMRGGALVAETQVSIGREDAFPERQVVLRRPGTQGWETLARYSTGYVPYRAPDSYGFLSGSTGSEGDWAVAGDSVLAVASGEPATLRWWRSGPDGFGLAGQMALPFPPRELTDPDQRALLDEMNERRRNLGQPPLTRSAEVAFPDYWGQVGQLVISDRLEGWIQWNVPGEEDDRTWVRVDLGSQQLTTVSLPPGFRMLAAAGDRLYGYVLTELDVPMVMVFRLQRS